MLWVFFTYMSWGAPDAPPVTSIKVEQGPFPTEAQCRTAMNKWNTNAQALYLREQARGVHMSTMVTQCAPKGTDPVMAGAVPGLSPED